MGPVKEGTYYFVLFAAHLFTQKLAHGTIKSYVAVVCYNQIYLGLGDLISTRYIS